MLLTTLEIIRCPACRAKLTIDSDQATSVCADELVEGFLVCSNTYDHRYAIVNGIPLLVADLTRLVAPHSDSAEAIRADCHLEPVRRFINGKIAIAQRASTALWDRVADTYVGVHFGSAWPPPALKRAMDVWGAHCVSLPPPSLLYNQLIKLYAGGSRAQVGVDIGCATGRMTHELARHVDIAIGVELSYPMLRHARAISKGGGDYQYHEVVEGTSVTTRTVHVEAVVCPNVDFVLADAEQLALPDNLGGIVQSFNVVDAVADPRAHLAELVRVASHGSNLLMSSPYSWFRVSAAPTHLWMDDLHVGDTVGKALFRQLRAAGFAVTTHFDPVPWAIRWDSREFGLWLVDVFALATIADEHCEHPYRIVVEPSSQRSN